MPARQSSRRCSGANLLSLAKQLRSRAEIYDTIFRAATAKRISISTNHSTKCAYWLRGNLNHTPRTPFSSALHSRTQVAPSRPVCYYCYRSRAAGCFASPHIQRSYSVKIRLHGEEVLVPCTWLLDLISQPTKNYQNKGFNELVIFYLQTSTNWEINQLVLKLLESIWGLWQCGIPR
jgi:hypothetical protein